MNMATEGFDDAQFQTSGQPQDRCIPVFYTRAVEDKEATLKQGRPMFRDVAYVQILVPGNNKDIMDRAVKEEDKQRWPRQWAAYQNGQEQVLEGTPLGEWPLMRPAQIAQLNAVNIRTVEQIADASDAAMQGIGMGVTVVVAISEGIGMGARELQAKAKAYLASAKDSKGAEALQDEVVTLKAEVERLTAENAELQKNQKKSPGRPPKNEEKDGV